VRADAASAPLTPLRSRRRRLIVLSPDESCGTQSAPAPPAAGVTDLDDSAASEDADAEGNVLCVCCAKALMQDVYDCDGECDAGFCGACSDELIHPCHVCVAGWCNDCNGGATRRHLLECAAKPECFTWEVRRGA
jgi:hypothetical protein